MTKYRIMESKSKFWRYYVQKRIFFFFWVTVQTTDYYFLAKEYFDACVKGDNADWKCVAEY